jgi:hypothetical protein
MNKITIIIKCIVTRSIKGAAMSTEELRVLMRSQPFKPFVVCLPSGKEVPIIHHDFAFLSPDGRTLFAYQRDMSFDMMDVISIENVKLAPPAETSAPHVSNGPTSN